jgi:hypothetical protein
MKWSEQKVEWTGSHYFFFLPKKVTSETLHLLEKMDISGMTWPDLGVF